MAGAIERSFKINANSATFLNELLMRAHCCHVAAVLARLACWHMWWWHLPLTGLHCSHTCKRPHNRLRTLIYNQKEQINDFVWSVEEALNGLAIKQVTKQSAVRPVSVRRAGSRSPPVIKSQSHCWVECSQRLIPSNHWCILTTRVPADGGDKDIQQDENKLPNFTVFRKSSQQIVLNF